MLTSPYKFKIDPIDGHITSSMHCVIRENSYQEIDFYYFNPIFDSWTRGMFGSRISWKLHGSGQNPVTETSLHYCGFFPENPASWCAEIYGIVNRNHEYSSFLQPPELEEAVEAAGGRGWRI
ncbi:MAG: hypothetical protein WBF90_35970 [Rivularia sp. (in: cyanobacteria)]